MTLVFEPGARTVESHFSFLLDSNSLLGFAAASRHNGSTARSAIIFLQSEGFRLYLTPQVLIEFHAVATRDPGARGLGWKPVGALRTSALVQKSFEFLPDVAEIFPKWEYLTKKYSVRGKKVHDARLAAVALTYGIPNILTSNTADFA